METGSLIKATVVAAIVGVELCRQGMQYYLRTHAHPNSEARYTMSSLLDLITFDAVDQLELLNQSLLNEEAVSVLRADPRSVGGSRLPGTRLLSARRRDE